MHRLGCLTLWLALVLLVLLPLLFYRLMETALGKLGLTPGMAFLCFLAMLIGGAVNIPVWRIPRASLVRADPLAILGLGGLLPNLWDLRQHTVVAVNVGGCMIPAALAIYQVVRLAGAEDAGRALIALVLASTLNIAACWKLARPLSQVGIVVPGLIPPLLAASSAILLAREHAPQVAYVAGVLGPLVGADLLRLRDLARLPVGLASIGGAGTFDGIVLSGVLAAFLA